ncbi:hypothetical protein TNCV_1860191 [Trichonephila clavipes]|nr:hypothetical protein TNCV_1860191 [Trichonephila clavipes]
MNEIRKTLVGLDYATVLPEEFVVVDDDNVYTEAIKADRDILEFIQSSENIMDADSDDEYEVTNASPFGSSDMRNISKSVCNYLYVPSSGEMNNKMERHGKICCEFDTKEHNAKKTTRL